jgi:hypothetical protein
MQRRYLLLAKLATQLLNLYFRALFAVPTSCEYPMSMSQEGTSPIPRDRIVPL